MHKAQAKTRLYFDFTRTGKFVEHGVCAIDVVNPADDNEVALAVKTKDYAYMQILEREYDEVDWNWSEWDEEDYDLASRIPPRILVEESTPSGE